MKEKQELKVREQERERIIELLNLWRRKQCSAVSLLIGDLINYGINGQSDNSSTFRYMYQGDYMKWLNATSPQGVSGSSDDESNDSGRQETSRRSSKRGHSGKEYNKTGQPSDPYRE